MDEKDVRKGDTLLARIQKAKARFSFFICKFNSKTSCIYISEIKSHLSETSKFPLFDFSH